jgi:hypothetical protein
MSERVSMEWCECQLNPEDGTILAWCDHHDALRDSRVRFAVEMRRLAIDNAMGQLAGWSAMRP